MSTPDEAVEREENARRLFRYVTGDEWRDYRTIMSVFAGTFFSEFTVDDVTVRLDARGESLDAAVLGERLESLRRWGNLTVSSATGNPTSIADYYHRRNRYLITRAGQEVHGVVEGVLLRIDEVRDISTSRLRALADALRTLATTDPAHIEPIALADHVRAVFDPHEAFTSEITQFFAAINQWQSRYDLSPEEFTFFAEVLVGYVAERLDEVERTARPIGRLLIEIEPRVRPIVERVNRGLESRIEEAGLGSTVSVARLPGTTVADWDHLIGWFVSRDTRPSRIEQLGRQAVAAIRTLTMNLTRLSRMGVGATSRRADFLRLAGFFERADPDDVPLLAVAAFGLHSSNHWGVPAEDSADPVSTATSWADAPRAPVPVSLRERGDTINRGRATPMRDRSLETRLLRRHREADLAARTDVDDELLAAGELDGHVLSDSALRRVQELTGRALHQLGVHDGSSDVVEGRLRCAVRRTPGEDTVIHTASGSLRLHDLRIALSASDQAAQRRGTGTSRG
jgi:uncharacterized protein (TIGR02677 family)